MSKASARHAKRGVNNRKFAADLAAKKQKNIDKQRAAEESNRQECAALGIVLQKGDRPSRALRKYYREGYSNVRAIKAALEAKADGA